MSDRILFSVKTTISSKGQIVLPAEEKRVCVQQETHGYRLTRRAGLFWRQWLEERFRDLRVSAHRAEPSLRTLFVEARQSCNRGRELRFRGVDRMRLAHLHGMLANPDWLINARFDDEILELPSCARCRICVR
jgi:hypothetical protein